MFNKIISSIKNLNTFERILWLVSVLTVTISFLCLAEKDYTSLIASLVGVTALIFIAKGDVFGHVLVVIFSVFYGIISYSFKYYGEMITYLCMSAPMAILSIISWIKNPYAEHEVKVNRITKAEIGFMLVLVAAVTFAFYYILKFFDTANLMFSTASVGTSFLAAYLTFRRSVYYALFYAVNDIVLIVLWVLATMVNVSYLPMIICFVMFLINDMYGFVNWCKIRKRQEQRYMQ